MANILLTGGSGFVGSHVAEYFLAKGHKIVSFDRLDCSSTYKRLAHLVPNENIRVVWGDLRTPLNDYVAEDIGEVDVILHLAAGSHVDRSIADPMSFVMDNVVGTTNILLYMKQYAPKAKCINMATDEVFGPAPDGTSYKEWDRFNAGNPYSASKAGAQQMGEAFANTYGLNILSTFGMNIIGERQHYEKFFPKVIRSVLTGEELLIHSHPDLKRAGTRCYIYAANVAHALHMLMEKGTKGERYNIVGEREIDNLSFAQMIADKVQQKTGINKLNYKMTNFHESRPGHDLAYRLDGSKLKEMGHEHLYNFDESVDKSVEWYLNNRKWLGL